MWSWTQHIAANVAGGFERFHPAKTRRLVEQEEDPSARPAVGHVDGVQEGADEDAGDRRRGFEGAQADIQKDGGIADQESARIEVAFGYQLGIGGDEEPFDAFDGVQEHAAEGFLGLALHQGSGKAPRHRAAARDADMRQ